MEPFDSFDEFDEPKKVVIKKEKVQPKKAKPKATKTTTLQKSKKNNK